MLKFFIALVWLINGLYCKLLNGVPRHELIVARILGPESAPLLTRIIGFLEILMAVWIISGIRSRWCAVLQILLVAVMNVIEFIWAPDLLLFGRINIIVAAAFISLIYWNEYRNS
ncbi:DoxX-like family protein [Chitinophaga sp. 212800010-3]|uniref:DoxX-like family protein n=1 Tax=unclassified Chitinophaga TaxID=2619133 RepID=UPI002DF65517|nr:DoxX-like family protein [Chitinophaga sp. 212800010-3]